MNHGDCWPEHHLHVEYKYVKDFIRVLYQIIVGFLKEPLIVTNYCKEFALVIMVNIAPQLADLSGKKIAAAYEADSQIAFLLKHGYADFAISVDSDLLAYGCKIVSYRIYIYIYIYIYIHIYILFYIF